MQCFYIKKENNKLIFLFDRNNLLKIYELTFTILTKDMKRYIRSRLGIDDSYENYFKLLIIRNIRNIYLLNLFFRPKNLWARIT